MIKCDYGRNENFGLEQHEHFSFSFVLVETKWERAALPLQCRFEWMLCRCESESSRPIAQSSVKVNDEAGLIEPFKQQSC